ncbi:TRAP transporter permease [Thermococcus piezophilus]|uniref:C4-dicarboxylate ABC transporter permease n=1 Tax=Thermococcus piezophilus TaxID=1712654 RepID=A0A172WHT7_9EURY|nr:TRAP transporter fused permease subunit [Thermococcus piezophilus]ANF23032.1 C4-dicarboxylate ABC transporter permease [Thermococcus piezophilus]
MGEGLQGMDRMEYEEVVIERTRTLPPRLELVVKIAAILIGLYEILFIFNFNYTLYDLFSRLGLKLEFLRITFQPKQGEAFVLAMLMAITFLLYPIRKKEKYFKKVFAYDYVMGTVGVISMIYLFAVYQRYILMSTLNDTDVIFGLLAIIMVIEATRRVLGWVLPLIVTLFLVYGIYAINFDWVRFVQQLYFDEGIFGIPFFVMTIYVFAFIFFGAFLLRIGVSDYITEFMISLFGKRPGGPAKSAVISSALMGTVSGSSVANVLTTGTFTIPLMKKAGYPPEIAGAVEPVASTGGQLMPPIMGAAAFIMAEFLNLPYNKIIIAAVLPALVYYGGVYLFIDLETKRLGLKGMATNHFKTMTYFLRKLYILLPIIVITVALVWGIAPQIAAISSLGVAIWVAWISRDEIYGNEKLYVAVAIIATLLMFLGKDIGTQTAMMLLAMFIVLVVLGVMKKGVAFNEKFYITAMFLLFIALAKYLGMTKEQIVLMTGVFGIVFSILVGYRSSHDSGRMMYRATYEAMIDAGKTSVSVMLAAASAGLIQGVLTMTGELTNIGYRLISLTGGHLWLLLMLTMVFSLILGMGVPTTANYIITSLVAAPAIYMLVRSIEPYNQPVPGYTVLIAMLSAHFFVFYFGILADVTPPVALASYAGSAIAGGDFWKTAMNAVKYALAGYIGPYIYFTHPEMFLITVAEWNLMMVLRVAYYLAATLFVMYLLAIALTGFYSTNLKKWIRAVFGVIGLAGVTLNPIVIGAGVVAWLGLKLYGKKHCPGPEPL